MQRHEDWIDFAEQDLAIAKLVLREGVIFKPAFFNTQQCSEKALKGYLAREKESITMTHNLAALLWQCDKHKKEFADLLEKISILNTYTIKSHYPQKHRFFVNKELLNDAIEKAAFVLNFVKDCIGK
jgi:HEPN domain-containing protein